MISEFLELKRRAIKLVFRHRPMKAQPANAKDDGSTTDSAAPHCVTPLMPQSAFRIAPSFTPNAHENPPRPTDQRLRLRLAPRTTTSGPGPRGQRSADCRWPFTLTGAPSSLVFTDFICDKTPCYSADSIPEIFRRQKP